MHHPEIKPQNLQVIWNVQFITVFVRAWMILLSTTACAGKASRTRVPPVQWVSSLSAPPGSKTSRCQRTYTSNGPRTAQPLHGLKLVIKEEVLPMKDQPEFPALALLASRGLLAPDAWKCKRAQVSLKATIDVPMLAQSSNKMVMGFWKIPTCQWDGHYTSMVPSGNVVFIDLQPPRTRRHVKRIRHERDSVEINLNAPQWSHNAVWNRKYMEPKTGYTLRQLWADSEPAIGQKSSLLMKSKVVTSVQ